MKRGYTFFASVLLATIIITPESRVSAQITWLYNLKEAQSQALQENKLILADFWAEWCGPCIRMDKEVWNRYYIEDLSNKFVCVRIDFDRQNTLASWYGVSAIPAMVFLDGYGNKLIHITGYRSVEKMGQVMSVLPEDFSEVYGLLKRIEIGEDGVDLVIEVADRYRWYGMNIASNKHYKKVSKLREVKDNPQMVDHIQTYTALNYLFMNKPKKARKMFLKCLKKFPESDNRPLHLFSLINTNLKLRKEKEAREYFGILKEEFPEDRHTQWAEELMKE